MYEGSRTNIHETIQACMCPCRIHRFQALNHNIADKRWRGRRRVEAYRTRPRYLTSSAFARRGCSISHSLNPPKTKSRHRQKHPHCNHFFWMPFLKMIFKADIVVLPQAKHTWWPSWSKHMSWLKAQISMSESPSGLGANKNVKFRLLGSTGRQHISTKCLNDLTKWLTKCPTKWSTKWSAIIRQKCSTKVGR